MSNLSNLYISESYYGVVNLIDATEPFVSQSAGRIYLTDGLGENLGLSLDYTKRVSIDNGLTVTGSVLISGSFIHTGSLDINGDITASGTISAGTGSFDTVNARVLHVLVESSSVILSSGSNQIGDEITDVQKIIGITTISGSLGVTGTQSNTGSLFVSNAISSSTIVGMGNVTAFSSSVDSRINNLSSSVDTTITNLSSSLDSRLDYLEGPFSTSVDARLVSLENFSSSLVANFVTDAELSAALETVTSSLQSQIDTKLDTGSFNSYTSSIAITINSKLASSWTGSVFTPFSSSVSGEITSIENTNTTQQSEINALIASTGSYAKLSGGNNFTGTQNISGSLNVEGVSTYTGSLAGNVVTLGVASSTASMDCTLGNFFVLNLPTGSNTHITATNIRPGLTLTLQINQDANGYGTAEFSTTKFNFPRLNLPNITQQAGIMDIATFVSFDSNTLNGVLTNDLI